MLGPDEVRFERPQRLSFAAGTHGGLLTREADYRDVRAPRLAPRASERLTAKFTTQAVAVLKLVDETNLGMPPWAQIGY